MIIEDTLLILLLWSLAVSGSRCGRLLASKYRPAAKHMHRVECNVRLIGFEGMAWVVKLGFTTRTKRHRYRVAEATDVASVTFLNPDTNVWLANGTKHSSRGAEQKQNMGPN